MEKQEEIRFIKFLEDKAFTYLSTEQARKVFIAEYRPDNQGKKEKQLAQEFYIEQSTYKKHKTEMYKQLELPLKSRNRKTYFLQLLKLRFPRKQSEQSNIHPDGQTLASASHDGTVKLRNLPDGKELHTFETNFSRVSSVSFSSDGKTLTFTSINGTEIQWNLDLEDLLKCGCNWLQHYLKTNPNVSDNDKLLCDGIGTQK